MKKLYYIYGLKDPVTNEIRYIGKTSQKLIRRWGNHLSEARNSLNNRYKNRWIKGLLDKGQYPTIEILDRVEDWNFWERFYILKYKKLGNKLTNLTKGGTDMPEEQKKYIKAQSKPIYSLDIENLKIHRHTSVVDAAKELNTNTHNIHSALYLKGKCKNRYWSYEVIDKNFEFNVTKNHKMVKVTKENKIYIFTTIKDSVEKLGFKWSIKNSVYKSLDEGIMYKGYKWEKLEARVKLGELLENPEADDQQPS